MPGGRGVVSKAQGAYLGIHHPEVLRRYKAEGENTKTKGLPYKVPKKATTKVKVRVP